MSTTSSVSPLRLAPTPPGLPVELEAERRRQGLGIAEVARRAGLPASTARSALRPGANPKLATLHGLGRALGYELSLVPVAPRPRRRWLRRPRRLAA
jgi:transcriptional regulator with XRE-family HTH domain